MKVVLRSIPFRVMIVLLLILGLDYGLIQLSSSQMREDQIRYYGYKDMLFNLDEPAADRGNPAGPPATGWDANRSFTGASHYWASFRLPDTLPPDTAFTVQTNADYYAVYLDGKRIYRYGQPGQRQWTNSEGLHVVPLKPDASGKVIQMQLFSDFGQSFLYTVYIGNQAVNVHNLFMQSLFRETIPIGLDVFVSIAAFVLWTTRRKEIAGLLVSLMSLCLIPQVMLQKDASLRFFLWPQQGAITLAGVIALDLMVLLVLAFIGTMLERVQRRRLYAVVMPIAAAAAALHTASYVYDDAAAAVLDLLMNAISLVGGLYYGVILIAQYRRKPSRPSSIALTGVLVLALLAIKDLAGSYGFYDDVTVPVLHDILTARQVLWGALAMVVSFGWSRVAGIRQANRSYTGELEAENVMLTRTNAAYARFVPKAFLEHLNRDRIVDVRPGDQVRRRMTVLFSDIRGFTALSESMTPEETYQFLNDFAGEMEPLIAYHGGFIDSYMGDGFMALFEGEADGAVDAAVSMLFELGRFNEKRLALGLQAVDIGIGVDTGEMLLGTLGGEDRMEGTVIGDAVNTASSIEELTKVLGTRLLISEETYRALAEPERHAVRAVDKTGVKGRRRSVSVYEVLDAEAPDQIAQKLEVDGLLQEGRARMERREYHQAIRIWESCLRAAPDDRVVQMWKERCRQALRLDPVN